MVVFLLVAVSYYVNHTSFTLRIQFLSQKILRELASRGGERGGGGEGRERERGVIKLPEPLSNPHWRPPPDSRSSCSSWTSISCPLAPGFQIMAPSSQAMSTIGCKILLK